MVVRFTTTYVIGAYHHWCFKFKSGSGRGVQHYVIKFVSDRWFSPGTPVSSTNKTDRHDIAEILFKVDHKTKPNQTTTCNATILSSELFCEDEMVIFCKTINIWLIPLISISYDIQICSIHSRQTILVVKFKWWTEIFSYYGIWLLMFRKMLTWIPVKCLRCFCWPSSIKDINSQCQ